MSLAPRSDEFECQGQSSRSPGTKTAFSAVSLRIGHTTSTDAYKKLGYRRGTARRRAVINCTKKTAFENTRNW